MYCVKHSKNLLRFLFYKQNGDIFCLCSEKISRLCNILWFSGFSLFVSSPSSIFLNEKHNFKSTIRICIEKYKRISQENRFIHFIYIKREEHKCEVFRKYTAHSCKSLTWNFNKITQS